MGTKYIDDPNFPGVKMPVREGYVPMEETYLDVAVMPTIKQFEDNWSFGNVNWTQELAEKFDAQKHPESYTGADGREYYHATFKDKATEKRAARHVASRIWNSDSVAQDPIKFASKYTGLPTDNPTVKNYASEIKKKMKEKTSQRLTEDSFKRTDKLARVHAALAAAPPVEEATWMNSLPNSIKAAYNQSIQGAAYKLMKGKEKFDLSGYEPSMLEDITAQMASFLMPADLLTLAAGGGIGGGIARKLVLNGVSKSVAKRAVTRGVVKAKSQALMAGTTAGSQLGFYDGLREGIETKARDGSVDIAKVVEATAQGVFVGASMGGIGGVLAAKGVKTVPKITAEIATFGSIMPIAEGEVPTPQDYVTAATMVLGLKGAGGITKRTYNAFKDLGVKTSKPERFTPKEAKAMAVESVDYTQLKISEQRAKPIETLERIKTAEGRGKKPEDLAETWRSIFNPKDELIIGETFTSKTGKKMVPIYDVKTGQVLPAVSEEAFYKTHSRSKIAMGKAMPKEGEAVSLRRSRLDSIESTKKPIKEGGLGLTEEEVQHMARGALNTEKNIVLKDLKQKDLAKVSDSFKREVQIQRHKDFLLSEGLHVPELPKYGTLYRALQPFRAAEKQHGLSNIREGREFNKAVDIAMHREKTLQGEMLDDLLQLNLLKPKGKIFKKGLAAEKYRSKIADDMENPAMNTEFNKYMDKLYFEKILPFAKKHNWKIHPYRKNYFPQMLRQDILDTMYDDIYTVQKKFPEIIRAAKGGSGISHAERMAARKTLKGEMKSFDKKTREALERIKSRHEGMDNLSAFEMLQQYTFNDKFKIFGNLEKGRTLDLPKSFYERDAAHVLTRYTTKLGRRMAQVEQFGPKAEKADKFFADISRKSPRAAQTARDIYIRYNGTIEVNPRFGYSKGTRNFLNEYMAFSVATKIAGGFSTLFNVTQTLISTAVEAGLYRTMKSSLKLVSPTKGGKLLRQEVRRSGSSAYDVIKEISGLQHSDTLLSKVAQVVTVPFNLVNKANNVLAGATARDFVKDLHRIANSAKSKKRKWAIGKLKEFNVDYRKKLDDRTLRESMVKFARESQLQKNVLKDPLAFNNPIMRPFLMFKRFGFRQATYMKKVLIDEANKGNVLPFFRIAAGGWAGGEFVNWARNNIRESLGGEPQVRPTGIYERAIENYTSVGALGMAADLAVGFKKDRSLAQAVTFAATPLQISDVDRVREWAQGIEEDYKNGYGLENALKRSAVNFSKPFGSLATELAKRYQKKFTPEQAHKRMKAFWGREKNEILDLYIEAEEADRLKQPERAKRLRNDAGRKQADWNDAWDGFGYGLYIMDIRNSDIIERFKTFEERRDPEKRKELKGTLKFT